MRATNTSSIVGSISSRRFTRIPLASSAARMRARPNGVVHRHVQPAAEDRHVETPSAPRGRAWRPAGPATRGAEARAPSIPSSAPRARPGRSPCAVHQRQAMAILGLIHVVRADENGVAGARQVLDQRPEDARAMGPRRSRLVQKQDGGSWRMAHPSASAVSNRPIASASWPCAARRCRPFRARIPCAPPAARAARRRSTKEVDVLLHLQIVVEGEFLRHVPDAATHFFGA